ncbi:SRPBCC domain-containing protein [Bacillus infantis]|uniref:SRPBCC family protein n=1 Tax=Bacillus infantis TaxID=324767 RepID=UPI001CD42B94|nr:SRPBCC domain-containing protein [Bacillus infantis]MCA1042266.1 SRPBCC domain-containing protein [Bacillus infantis]
MTMLKDTRTGLVVSRKFDAPRELVFKAWTEAEHLKNWWGPKGYAMKVTMLELHPKGMFHYSQKSPEGYEIWGRFIYDEISPPDKLIFINSFSDEEGSAVRAPFNSGWPLEVVNHVNFISSENQTEIELLAFPLNPEVHEQRSFDAALDGLHQEYSSTFSQLDEYLRMVK